ncbi:hypothetical protein BST61_g9286 [Cercospora zeina]
MEILYFSNEIPEDNLPQVIRFIRQQSKSSRHVLLSQFIAVTRSAIKEEVDHLPPALRSLFASFDDISQWAADKELRGGQLCGAIDGVLLVFVQISLYLIYIEQNPSHFDCLPQSHLTALGIGLLSAAALSISSTPNDLVHFGMDAIVIAFRLGVHVHTISEHLESSRPSESRESWAYVLHNTNIADVQAELDALNQGGTFGAATNKLIVSAVSRTSVTISGPPSRLRSALQKSRMLRNAHSIALPVYGGFCHAPHVYGRKDTLCIVRGAGSGLHSASRESFRTPTVPLHDSSTGSLYSPSSALGLFEDVVSECLTQIIDWVKVVSTVVQAVTTNSNGTVRLNHFGNTTSLNDLKTSLEANMNDTTVSMTNYATTLLGQARASAKPRDAAQSKLAIVGMSCRLPGAAGPEEFWDLLEQGLDVSRRIPPDRFDIDLHYDPKGQEMNKVMTQYGCFIDEPSLFDAPFFNMSPREALAIDPQMRLMLVTAYEALEQAGFVSNRTIKSERIGTYYGQSADDYREVNQGQEVGTYYIPGGCRAFGPGRVNYFFKFAGPSYSIDTACSSGLAAIEVACQALWSGTVDMAVTGGVNILTNPDGFCGLSKGHFLTTGHNACKTWDATADGYCRAEGVGSLVIKRLEDAKADKDNILGVILAAGTNHSAEAVSITHPHAGHQSHLTTQLLDRAGVNPLDVSYVELHGTGTQAGDFEEMRGVLDIYAPASPPRRRNYLSIGSCKANIGHGESVSGTTSLIKVLLMLQKESIPRHIGIKTAINPRFPKDFETRKVSIPFSQTSWARGEHKRIAAVNNFGAAGGNTTMLLEEAPPLTGPSTEDPRETHVIAISAKTRASLLGNVNSMIGYLDNSKDQVKLADLSYTTTARRNHYSYRIAVAASTIEQAREQLALRAEQVHALRPISKPSFDTQSMAFTFTGQGASYNSMGLDLYRSTPGFREHVQQLDNIAQAQGFPSFIPALDGTDDADQSHSAVVTQLALVSLEIALAYYWESLGVVPNVVVGHSMGEFAALHVAGVISSHDALFMVGRRAQLLEERCVANSHRMIAVAASPEDIHESTAADSDSYTVACINGPSSTVLSGSADKLDGVVAALENAGHRCVNVRTAYAFHSDQMDPILDDFEAICKGVIFHDPRVPFISPLLGKVIYDGYTINANYLRRATREPVDFVSAIKSAFGACVTDETTWIEIGPHPVCVGLIRTILPNTTLAVPTIRRGESNWKTLAETLVGMHLSGITVNWSEFHRPFDHQLLLLPAYSWDEKSYWMQYKGDWSLRKGNSYYGERAGASTPCGLEARQDPVSALVHSITHLDVDTDSPKVAMQSNLMQRDFLAAVNGHFMNGQGVVTSSIHAEIAFTLGSYLYCRLHPDAQVPGMELRDMVVTKGLVAKKSSPGIPQTIQVTASMTSVLSDLHLAWQSVATDGTLSEPFATAKIVFEDSAAWLGEWSPMSHLITHRIETLEQMAHEGQASRFAGSWAYDLFAKNLVDYSQKYRGMQSVVMHRLEAFANVQLSTVEYASKGTVAHHFIDSVAHLAGFVVNCSECIDTRKEFCVTPGWKSMRFAEPLVAGAQYRSYVKMIPTEDSTVYLGDVYVLRKADNVIIGMVQAIQFRRYPRILLDTFFSAPTVTGPTKPSTLPGRATKVRPSKPPAAPIAHKMEPHDSGIESGGGSSVSGSSDQEISPQNIVWSAEGDAALGGGACPAQDGSIAVKALHLIAEETAIDTAALADDVEFATVGVDSLLSLVIAERLQRSLGVKVNGSLFLEYPTVGHLRRWLIECYG